MSKYYNNRHLPHPDFQVGELVMLNGKNIRTKRPSKKLAPKLYGPFKILGKVGNRAYRLELQDRWRIHDTFHVSLLEKFHDNKIEGRSQIRPEPEEIEGEREYEVERILQSEIREKRQGRRKKKSLFYLVKWKGYPNDECTWEPGIHLTNAHKEVEEFHQQNPTAVTL